MSDQIDVSPIQSYLQNSRDVIIALTQNPSLDQVAAALGMFLTLKTAGKQVSVVCSSSMTVEFSRLVGLDEVKSTIGNKNLVVSFDYIQDSIEKVNYHVEGNKFNLVIQPKKGAKPLDPKQVEFFYSGLQADVMFIIGAQNWQDLGEVYTKNQDAITQAYAISLNRQLTSHFAQTTITNPEACGESEITAWFMTQLGYQPTDDAASNLLSGIDAATNRFSSPNTPASAFLTAGQLIQQGATRQIAPQRPKNPNLPASVFKPPQPTQKNHGLLRPMTIADSSQTPPDSSQLKQDSSPEAPPKDWLEPKIYQGTTRV